MENIARDVSLTKAKSAVFFIIILALSQPHVHVYTMFFFRGNKYILKTKLWNILPPKIITQHEVAQENQPNYGAPIVPIVLI